MLLNERWQSLNLSQIPISGSPNIAVEIISPCERTAESTRKVWVYLRADVEEVWQIHPRSRTVSVNRRTGLGDADDDVTATPLLAQWRMALSELFVL